MSKVTSKLQVTVPKALAERFHIEPGDDIEWEAAGDVIRIVPPRKKPMAAGDVATRLKLFDQATARQLARDRAAPRAPEASRGWNRQELYERGRPR